MEFMNLSGFAVQRTAAFHAVDPVDILVVHDEIDLELGVVRLKNGGGHGGHNGLRSIMEQLGHGKFARLRMGVGRDPNVPPGSGAGTQAVAGWVLSDFPAAQAGVVTAMIKAGCEDIQTVLARGIGPAMNQHNARPKLSSPGIWAAPPRSCNTQGLYPRGWCLFARLQSCKATPEHGARIRDDLCPATQHAE
jgi:PTH1 family peptidyl-tRNA hydrolase